MVVVKLASEASQAVQRASVIVLSACAAQLMLDAGPVALGQLIEHVRSDGRAPRRTRR